MKFLCVPCDTPMQLANLGPIDRGSLSVVYSCPACGYEMAMLTNAAETQVVRSLGVRIGPEGAAEAPAEGSRCPFSAMIPGLESPGASAGDSVPWTAEASARLQGIPEFVRPMAKSGIERFAKERGYPTIDGRVLDEARAEFGM